MRLGALSERPLCSWPWLVLSLCVSSVSARPGPEVVEARLPSPQPYPRGSEKHAILRRRGRPSDGSRRHHRRPWDCTPSYRKAAEIASSPQGSPR